MSIVHPAAGVVGYLGKTQTGKTTLALAELREAIAATGWPSVIVDLMPASNFISIAHLPDSIAVFDRVYGAGRHACWTPKNESDLAAFCAGAQAAGRLCILIDEARWAQSSQSMIDQLSKLLRSWGHAGAGAGGEPHGLWIGATSQHPGDLHATFYACVQRWRFFRVEGDAALERLRRNYGITAEALAGLGEHDYLEH